MGTSKTRVRSRHQIPAKPLVPAEGNFEEHPYFRVGDRNSGTGILQYKNELRTAEGNVLKQSWTVRAAHGRGLPGRFDQDVYVALLQMIDERGLPEDGWIGFSLYELVELMGKSHSGRDYKQVRESLQRLATTSIESENAFYHRGKKEYLSDTFSLLTEVKVSEYEGPNGERGDRNRVHLSKFFVESYRSNYLKNLDAELYWSLSSPIAKRLYRLVDKKRGGKKSWEVDLFSLRDRIPLSSYRYASKIKEKLTPAHQELIEKRFLDGVVYRKSSEGERVTYRISDSFRTKKLPSHHTPRTEEELFCIQRLRAEGIDSSIAESLVSRFGRDRAMHYVDALPYRKNLRNPAGWLRKAIENGYDLDLPPAATPPTDPPIPESPPLFEPETHNTSKVYDRPFTPIPDEEATRILNLLLDAASDLSGSPDLHSWFHDVIASDCSSGVLTIYAPNEVARDYIVDRFQPLLSSTLPLVSPDHSSVSVLVP